LDLNGSDLIVCGTPEIPFDPATEIVVADRSRDSRRGRNG
jgi:hypothetical protein